MFSVDEVNKKTYLNTVAKFLKNEIDSCGKFYKKIHYNLQNNKVIIRNLKIIKPKKRKDIIGLIKFEISQYIPINIEDYILKYIVLDIDNNELNVQVILVPKYILDICCDISKMLNMKQQTLNINFNILQKLINLNLVNNFDGNGVFIESKYDELIMSIVKNYKVYESYVMPKNIESFESLNKIISDFENGYYYGEGYQFIENHCSDLFKIEPLKLNMKMNLLRENESVYDESIKYINSIGMII
ncbi:pilus assembly protein PilM [Romboutsia maritimum]|uniref:Pilus assembly protein PilM n=1 Tax=Romboutsia maritimum TaxID=2020948 RepID=A0A371IVF1_9FIRM|nr:pilus assembly protein PilM [Romboutsia maritimum]RDY24441.1 pilus assembly protein PilM [Romboutsia maritimum]